MLVPFGLLSRVSLFSFLCLLLEWRLSLGVHGAPELARETHEVCMLHFSTIVVQTEAMLRSRSVVRWVRLEQRDLMCGVEKVG